MNRIENVFNKSTQTHIALIIGGDPDIETTGKLIIALAESGVDIIAIGIPFSDPVAEGATREAAHMRALTNGCTVDKLFEMLKETKGKIGVPLLFMTYANPVFVYGKERFMARCTECGIDGVIVPDLPFEEKDELSDACKNAGLLQIPLVAPASPERISMITKEAEGFIYCMSPEAVGQVKAASTIPCVIGAQNTLAEADGLIIDNAIIQLISEHGQDSVEPVKAFMDSTIVPPRL